MTDLRYSSKVFSSKSAVDTRPVWLSHVNLRLLHEADLPALEWEGEYTHFRRLYRDVYQSACRGEAAMWVADLPGKGVIGQVFVQYISARTELADGATRAYIYGFRIRPAYRGAGLGERLLQTIEDNLRQRGYVWVVLNVARQNLAGRRFYERYGYHVVAPEAGRWSYYDHEGQKREVDEPAWRMEKKL